MVRATLLYLPENPRYALELVPQSKLHDSRICEHATERSERPGLVNCIRDRGDVELGVVEHIEYFPPELQSLSLRERHLPGLAQCGIQPRKSGTANLVSPASFAGVVMAERANPRRPIRIGKKIGDLAREGAALFRDSSVRGTNLRCPASQLPVGGPRVPIDDAYRESAGPPRQP